MLRGRAAKRLLPLIHAGHQSAVSQAAGGATLRGENEAVCPADRECKNLLPAFGVRTQEGLAWASVSGSVWLDQRILGASNCNASDQSTGLLTGDSRGASQDLSRDAEAREPSDHVAPICTLGVAASQSWKEWRGRNCQRTGTPLHWHGSLGRKDRENEGIICGPALHANARQLHTRSWWRGRWFRDRQEPAGLRPLALSDERKKTTQADSSPKIFVEAATAPQVSPADVAEIQKQVVVDHSEHAVNVALAINGAVFLGKLLVYFWTTSDVMLAEAVHSLADIANQALLAYGIYLSRRAPDKWHPYGYGKDRFIWALISATGIFCCGAGINIVHGMHSIMSPEPVQNVTMALSVLAASGLAEGGSAWVAYKAVRESAKAEHMATLQYLWKGLDPTAVAVLMEDGAAVMGLGVAALALTMTHITGNPVYDAVGSIGIGVLLGGVAVFLIGRNRSALLGRSMDETEMQELMHLLKSDPVVHAIYDAKSEVIGPGEFRFKAEIDFRGDVVVRHFLQRAGHRKVLDQFEKALVQHSDTAVEEALEQYGTAIVQSIGDEVDRLEQVIQRKVPEMRHVDIEVHSRFGKSAYP